MAWTSGTLPKIRDKQDLFDESHPELRRLRRQEGTLHNRIRWYLAEMRHVSIHFKPNPELVPRWVKDLGPPLPEPSAEPEEFPHPPFDLTPEECPPIGEPVDLPRIIADRQEKKLQKAEARRDAKRRKVERLRA